MPYFKDPSNGLHFLESADVEQGSRLLDLLPPGSVAISDEEADQLRGAQEPLNQALARVLERVRIERASIFAVLDGLQSSSAARGLAAVLAGDADSAKPHAALAAEIEDRKQALRDAPQRINLDDCSSFEEALQRRADFYSALVYGASPGVRAAFRAVLEEALA